MCKNLHFLTNFEGISGNLGKVYFKLFKLVFNFYEGDLVLNLPDNKTWVLSFKYTIFIHKCFTKTNTPDFRL